MYFISRMRLIKKHTIYVVAEALQQVDKKVRHVAKSIPEALKTTTLQMKESSVNATGCL